MVKELTKEMFEEYFEYDPESPSGLRWKVDRYCGEYYNRAIVKAGSVAGSISKSTREKDINYKKWTVRLNGTLYLIHRVIYCLHHSSLSAELSIDHIDGNSLNNRIENLRAVTTEVNNRNLKMRITNTSGASGVKVQVDKGTGCVYIVARWRENNREKSKCFSVNKYGYDLAFELACEYREKAISKLNEKGYGYTERHGQV